MLGRTIVFLYLFFFIEPLMRASIEFPRDCYGKCGGE